MASRTEQALAVVVAALAAAAEGDDHLCAPTRNMALTDQLDELPGEGAPGAHLNLVDGAGRIVDVRLGEPRQYELAQDAEIEWIVQALDQQARDAAFDAGLEAIASAVESVQAAIEAGTHEGVLDDIEITGIERSNLAIDGVPQLKGAIITLRLQFVSQRPF